MKKSQIAFAAVAATTLSGCITTSGNFANIGGALGPIKSQVESRVKQAKEDPSVTVMGNTPLGRGDVTIRPENSAQRGDIIARQVLHSDYPYEPNQRTQMAFNRQCQDKNFHEAQWDSGVVSCVTYKM